MAQLVKNLSARAGDARDAVAIPGFGKIPWGRKWQPTLVFLPGKFHGQSLVSYSSCSHKESEMTECTNTLYTHTHTQMHTHTHRVFRTGMKTRFPVLWPLLSCPTLLTYSVHQFHSIIIWNSSPGIPSPSLVLFVVMLDFPFQNVWL